MTFDEWWKDEAPRTEAVQMGLDEKELCREAWNAALIAEAQLELAAAAANLYLVQWDGGSRYVEAATFGDPVKLWREAMKVEWGEDWSPEDEPDSVARVDDQPALRGKTR